MLTLSDLDDRDLWNLLQNGNEDALSELIRRFGKTLALYGRKLSKDDSLIQDCIQDTFVQIWQYRAGLREVSEIRPYLFTCLRRKIISEVKRKLNFERIEDDSFSPFHVDFTIQDKWIENETEAAKVKLLNQMINKLPKRQKEAIYLKFYENMGNSEIAMVMDIRYQTATNLLHEALASLRQWLPSGSAALLNTVFFVWIS